MRPGDDCLGCHSGGGEAKAWTVAGTTGIGGTADALPGRQGSSIAISDASGRSFTICANQAGNFYTAEAVTFPLSVAVDGQPMTGAVNDGSCNNCHGHGPGSGGHGGE
jgi:hypothetical protein